MAVPEGWDAAGLAFAGQSVAGHGDDFGRISANEQIGAFRNRDGTFGVLPQSETGHAESGGLLPDAAGVRENEGGFAEKAEKIEIAHRRDEAQLRVMTNTGFGQALLGARMDGEYDGHFCGDGVDGPQEVAQLFCGVDVRGTMQGQDAETAPASAVFQTELVSNPRLLGDGQEMAQRIDHYVADQENAFAGAAFLEEMLYTIFFGDEKIVGNGVGEDAVDLFGHGTVKTAEARFEVSDANAELHGGERNGDGGIEDRKSTRLN